jgi:hypothetical protein
VNRAGHHDALLADVVGDARHDDGCHGLTIGRRSEGVQGSLGMYRLRTEAIELPLYRAA